MRAWLSYVPLVALVACGRIRFDASGGGAGGGDGGDGVDDAIIHKDGHGTFVDAAFMDAPGTQSIDAAVAPDGSVAACANFDLGSLTGTKIATGTTVGQGDHYHACSGTGSPDVSYAWTAPATKQYTFDLCSGPDQSFDSTLTILNADCTGTQLACDDDGCGTTFLSKTKVSLTAGQLVIIIVDGDTDSGKFSLSIN